MASTAIPAVKAAIIELLEASEDLEGVTIAPGAEPDRDKEYIWFYKASATRDFNLLGGNPAPLDENLRIYMRVVAIKGSIDADPSEDRAYEIAEAVEAALRADLELDGTVFFHRIEAVEQEHLKIDRTRGCHVLLTLTAKTRI